MTDYSIMDYNRREDNMFENRAPSGTSKRSKYVLLAGLLMVASCVVLSGVVVVSHGSDHVGVATEDRVLSRSQRSAPLADDKTDFTFDDIFNSTFKSKSYTVNWLKGKNEYTYTNDSGDIVIRNLDNGSERSLVTKQVLDEQNATLAYVSSDASYVLLGYNYVKQWRRSFFASYKILTTSDGTVVDFPNSEELKTKLLLHASFATEGDALSFVYENNLYYQSSPTGEPQQLTFDGDALYIHNGVPDWLYEEDVTGTRDATYWSPDATYLAFVQFNDTGIPIEKYNYYGDMDEVYSKSIEFAYPKAGDIRDGKPGPTTAVNIYVVNINNLDDDYMQLMVPVEFEDDDYYYTQLSWMSKTTVVVTWTNRIQTHYIVSVCDVIAMTCSNIYEDTVMDGWVAAPWPEPIPSVTGSKYYNWVRHPVDDETGSWQTLVEIEVMTDDTMGTFRNLTRGRQEVLGVLALDEEMNYVYYYSNGGDARDKNLYRTSIDGSTEPECLTCTLADCEYTTASFSDTNDYYVLGCLGPDVPRFLLVNTRNETVESEVLEDNQALKDAVAMKRLPSRLYEMVTVGGDQEAYAEVHLPYGYMQGDRYPLLNYVYAGPGSQRVLKAYPLGSTINNWLMYLASTLKVAVASVDSRGASGRGSKYLFQMYRRLGTVEVADQIIAGEYFRSMDYIKSDENSAIFGWSYGGQTSSLVISNKDNIDSPYQCAIAVAPSTDKRYYDTAYTERYMGFPTEDDNIEGYKNCTVSRYAKDFANKTYMIAHGTLDDNVHFRHAAILQKELMNAEIQFRSYTYVDEHHSITGQRRHLFKAMSNFLSNECYVAGRDVIVAPTLSPPDNGAPKNHMNGFSTVFVCVFAVVMILFHK